MIAVNIPENFYNRKDNLLPKGNYLVQDYGKGIKMFSPLNPNGLPFWIGKHGFINTQETKTLSQQFKENGR